MSDIDKRLDEIITRILKDDPWTLAKDELIKFSNNWKQAIKQLMVDEFEKLNKDLYSIGKERFKSDPEYQIDAWIEDVDTYLIQKLKEWKQGVWDE